MLVLYQGGRYGAKFGLLKERFCDGEEGMKKWRDREIV